MTGCRASEDAYLAALGFDVTDDQEGWYGLPIRSFPPMGNSHSGHRMNTWSRRVSF